MCAYVQPIRSKLLYAYACNRVRSGSGSGYKLLTLGFEVLDFAQQEGKRMKGESIPGGCSSPSKGPMKRAAARPAVVEATREREGGKREGRIGTMRSSTSVGDFSRQQEIGQPI